MLSPLPRRGAWDRRFCSCSPNRVSLPRLEDRVGPRIVRFEACSAFTRVTACTLATSPYFVTRWSPEASTVSLPPQLLRLLPAGASRRVGLSPTGKRRLFTAHLHSGRSESRERTHARFSPRGSRSQVRRQHLMQLLGINRLCQVRSTPGRECPCPILWLTVPRKRDQARAC